MISFDSVRFVHQNGVVALENVDLKIGDGELVAIVGENGAGKTTLIKHINGLLKPTKGTVSVFGLDTKKTSVAQLSRRVGIVFQNPDHQLFSDSVENEIVFGLRNFGMEEETIAKRVQWALEFFGLDEYRKSSPLMLSGGEKKRLCLAMVLAWDPDVLILDEPTVGQDFAQKEKLEQIVRMLATRSKTVIIVSHDVEFIWPLQPRVIIMSRGQIIADGSAERAFSDRKAAEEANLVRPQLLDLYWNISPRPATAFRNVHEARQWLLQVMGGE